MKAIRGDVVLAEYPHSAGGSKMRPVLVVQSDAYNAKIDNTIVAQITSVLTRTGDPAHFLIDISTPEENCRACCAIRLFPATTSTPFMSNASNGKSAR